jgi:hypothetical protein
MESILDNRVARGDKVFNAAYIVSTNGKAMSKITFVLELADAARHLNLLPPYSLGAVYEALRTVKGLGAGFLAGQIIADLKYTPRLEGANDWNTWCSPGPGSLRGLNRLCGESVTARWDEVSFVMRVNDVRKKLEGDGITLHAQDVQNCLCEFDKYVRALEGGRPKQSYPGR